MVVPMACLFEKRNHQRVDYIGPNFLPELNKDPQHENGFKTIKETFFGLWFVLGRALGRVLSMDLLHSAHGTTLVAYRFTWSP